MTELVYPELSCTVQGAFYDVYNELCYKGYRIGRFFVDVLADEKLLLGTHRQFPYAESGD